MDWLHFAQDARPLWTMWMVILFVGIALYALWPRNKKHFEDCSRIPFSPEGGAAEDKADE